jgi:hypothetical protein
MDETDKPNIPEPSKPPLDSPDVSAASNGGGGSGHPTESVFMSEDGVVKWMETTDKELKWLRVQGMVLTAAVLLLIITAKPRLPSP